MILNELTKEQLAGYITPDNVVYSFAPDYIQEMAKETNKEYQKLYNTDFFKFEKANDMFGNNPPEKIKQIRKELEIEYTK